MNISRRLSLHPLSTDEALAALIQVNPERKKAPQKPRVARKGAKKKAKRK